MTSSTSSRPVLSSAGSPAAVMVVFAMAGLVMAQTFARMPAIRDAVDASKGELGLALIGGGLGSLLAMPFTGRLVDRFGTKRVVTVSIVLACAGWSSLAFVPNPWVMGVALVLTGAPVGIWDVAMNVQGSQVERLRGRSLMPFFHAAFSAGTVVGAGTGALAAYLGVGLLQLPAIGAMAMVIGLVSVRGFMPDQSADAEEAERPGGLPTEGQDVGGQPPARRGVSSLEIMIGVVCLGGALAEGSANDWLAILLVDVQEAPAALGALALTAFNLAMMTGRLLGSPAIDRFGRERVVQAGGLLATLGILLASQVPSLPVALMGGLIWGLGVSTIFPAAISAAGEIAGRGNRAITVVSTIAYGAFLFGAPTIGILAEAFGLSRALFVVIAFLIVMMVLARNLRPGALVPSAQLRESIQ
ncbi:MAG: MFS transporter [Ornithinimicrobium sp.]